MNLWRICGDGRPELGETPGITGISVSSLPACRLHVDLSTANAASACSRAASGLPTGVSSAGSRQIATPYFYAKLSEVRAMLVDPHVCQTKNPSETELHLNVRSNKRCL